MLQVQSSMMSRNPNQSLTAGASTKMDTNNNQSNPLIQAKTRSQKREPLQQMQQRADEESSEDEHDKMLWRSLARQHIASLDDEFERIACEDDYNYVSDEDCSDSR